MHNKNVEFSFLYIRFLYVLIIQRTKKKPKLDTEYIGIRLCCWLICHWKSFGMEIVSHRTCQSINFSSVLCVSVWISYFFLKNTLAFIFEANHEMQWIHWWTIIYSTQKAVFSWHWDFKTHSIGSDMGDRSKRGVYKNQ